MVSLQEIKRQLEDVGWDLLDRADAEENEKKASYLRDAEQAVSEAMDSLREAARL